MRQCRQAARGRPTLLGTHRPKRRSIGRRSKAESHRCHLLVVVLLLLLLLEVLRMRHGREWRRRRSRIPAPCRPLASPGPCPGPRLSLELLHVVHLLGSPGPCPGPCLSLELHLVHLLG